MLGGTFDPVHLGHLRIADTVNTVFRLPRVLLLPCAVPPHKPGVELAPGEHRLNMLRLAVEDLDRLEVSRLELDRGGVSYTIDSLRALRDDPSFVGHPLFILGMDSLIEIPTWKDYRALLDEFDLVVVDRPAGRDGDPAILESRIAKRLTVVPLQPDAGAALLSRQARPGGRIYRLQIEPLPHSSRPIRDRAARGASLAGLVPPAVARYIQRAGVYSQEEAR